MPDRLRAFFRLRDVGEGTPWRIFWVGLALRLLYITLAHTYRVRPAGDHFQFGWEAGRIARALANGYGYSDPFTGHTGPTAWLPPLFPLLLGGIFRVFGVYTATSAWVILAIDSIFSAGIALAVYEVGARCFDRRPSRHGESEDKHRARHVAPWSGWLWALYPAALQYAVHWIWDMSISTFFLAWTVVLALRIRGLGDSPEAAAAAAREGLAGRRWAIFGVLWGLIALSNASLLPFLPACGLWMVWRTGGSLGSISRSAARAALAAALFAACLAPWVWRNGQTFHTFIPTRGNLGAELYASTRSGNNGFPWGTTVPPFAGDPEFRQYKALGELAYVQQHGALARSWLRSHPRRFAQWTLKRVWFFWAGVPAPFGRVPAEEIARDLNYGFLSLAGLLGLALALWRKIPGASLLAAAFTLLPLPYYAITVQARFRHPIEPLLAVLAVYLFQSAESVKTDRADNTGGPGRPGRL